MPNFYPMRCDTHKALVKNGQRKRDMRFIVITEYVSVNGDRRTLASNPLPHHKAESLANEYRLTGHSVTVTPV